MDFASASNDGLLPTPFNVSELTSWWAKLQTAVAMDNAEQVAIFNSLLNKVTTASTFRVARC